MCRVNKQTWILWLSVILGLAMPGQAWQAVEFADENLKHAVEFHLGVFDPTPEDMLSLVRLVAVEQGIEDLTGLEQASNLQSLSLVYNRISDISPLSELTYLNKVILNNNQIQDVSPLSGLTEISWLDVHDNQLSDISSLSNLTGITKLVLRYNDIHDIGALSGMSDLESLDLHGNNFGDLSALAGLSRLDTLSLQHNNIDDLSPLSGLTNLTSLKLDRNDIRDLSPLSDLSQLSVLSLSQNEISDISPLLTLRGLRDLDLSENGPLNEAAYCSDLAALSSNSPGFLDLDYTENPRAVTGLWASQGTHEGKVKINWDTLCNGPDIVTYYQVFRRRTQSSKIVSVSEWQSEVTYDDTDTESAVQYYYYVRTATSAQGANRGILSDSVSGWASLSAGSFQLNLASSPGGSIDRPGEGSFEYGSKQTVRVEAVPADTHLFVFDRWTGTAVDEGYIDHPLQPTASLILDKDLTLKANFLTTLNTIYVSANAPGSYGGASGPLRNGTFEHPFDQIQQAVDVAGEHTSVVVYPGTYLERITFCGRNIQLLGINPEDPNMAFPIIDANESGPVLTFKGGEDPNCLVKGFVLTSGKGEWAGAIDCRGSSPNIENCLMVGNQSTWPEGGAVYCTDSNAVFQNCTISDNLADEMGAGLYLDNSDVIMINSILWNNAPTDLRLKGECHPVIAYCAIRAEGHALGAFLSGEGNIDVAPLFAMPGHWNSVPALDPDDLDWIMGDYHLKSEYGRWSPWIQYWTLDSSTSLCIDGGDPLASLEDEPTPHGDIINMGTYGGSVEGSKSRGSK
ncbi:MAG: hypothetical protein GY809_24575 [Planctomycetes bacterium]|nr:hypothetical protein [Planctomycetota bacterium]